MKQQREKKDVVQNWSHQNLRCQNFDFHLCKTVVTVDLFVVATVIAAAAAIVVPVVDAVGKNVQAQQWTVLGGSPY